MPSERMKGHTFNLGRKCSENKKKQQSNMMKGNKFASYVHSEEQNKRQSMASKERLKNKKLYTNPSRTQEKYFVIGYQPDGWKMGRKLRNKFRGKNKIKEVEAHSQPKDTKID